MGVLNKIGSTETMLGRDGIQKRIADWKRCMKEHGIRSIFEFDAHWDRYVKLNAIYETIAALLPKEKKVVFDHNLKRFTEELIKTEHLVAKRAAGCLLACRSIKYSQNTEANGFDRNATLKELRRKTLSDLQEYQSEFALEVLEAYRISVSGSDQNDPQFTEQSFKRAGARIGEMATHSAVFGAIGGVIGGIGGFFAGGPIGAVAGAKLGAGLLASWGLVSGAVTEIHNRVAVGKGVAGNSFHVHSYGLVCNPSRIW